ncbi:MAG: CDP-alcohol phosphatidyltransferase family protein [Isosphaeraceae bacterium]
MPIALLDKVLSLPTRKKSTAPRPKRPRPWRRRPAGPKPDAAPGSPTTLTKVLAWSVHFYTALGLVCAAGIAALLFEGGPGAFRWSFVLMAVATAIDATDGTLARKIRIKEVLPGFDGRKLDDITDFLTYTALPLVLVWRAGLLPPGTEWALVFPLLASAYGFCQCEAKTDDGYFLGFPSLWNVVAFYLYVLPFNPWVSLAVLMVLALMTFVPSKYLYPSQPGRLNMVCNFLGVGWTFLVGGVLWGMPSTSSFREMSADTTLMSLAWASLFFPLFYMGASWVVTLKHWGSAAAGGASIEEPAGV